MKRILVALGLIVSQATYSDDELIIQVRLNDTYELKAEYPVIVDKDRFVFSRYDKTGNSKEVVSLDPLLGTEKLLAGGIRDVHFLAANKSYVAIHDPGAGVPGRVKLLRKSDGLVFQSVRLSQGAKEAYFVGDQLVVLQMWSETAPSPELASHWSVFNVPTLKFVREFDAPAAVTIARVERGTVLLEKRHIGLYDDNFSEKLSGYIRYEPVSGGWCDPESLVVINQMAVFVANCGEIYSFSLNDGELKPRLRLDQRFYSLASDGTYLFAVPEGPADLPGHIGGVVVDLSTWKVVGKFDAMGHVSYANGAKLAVMSFPQWNKGLVSIYKYAPTDSLQTRRP